MSVEFQALVGAVVVLFFLLVFQGSLIPISKGLMWGLGSRNEQKPDTALEGRARRTIANHMESLAVFTPLVLAVEVYNLSNGLTETGAWLFVGARALFAPVYLIGLPFIRSLVWGVATLGLVLFAIPVIQAALA